MSAAMDDTLSRLAATIAARRDADPAQSWAAKLHAAGLPTIARKFGEEALETVVAALSEFDIVGRAEEPEVLAELERREGISGLAEKAARKG